jgi:FkbM family methyltransferase
MQRRAHDLVKRGFLRAGIVVSRWPSYHTSQYNLREILRRLNIDLVIDVGAFVGNYGRELRKLGYRGQIVSFEPARTSFKQLNLAAADDPDWDALRLAIGRETGKMHLHVWAHMPDMNSAAVPTAYGREYGMNQGEVETVDVRRLDDVIAIEGRRPFLKIDAQGLDFDVIAGAPTVLASTLALQIELSFVPAYEGMLSVSDALDMLHVLGFAVNGMYPVARTRDGLRITDFDCYLVRSPSS